MTFWRHASRARLAPDKLRERKMDTMRKIRKTREGIGAVLAASAFLAAAAIGTIVDPYGPNSGAGRTLASLPAVTHPNGLISGADSPLGDWPAPVRVYGATASGDGRNLA